LQQQRRRAGEQTQQQTQEARKRAETKARQAIEEQQRDAQWREQDEARRAAEAEAAPSESLRTPARPVAKLISDLAVFRDIDAPWCPEMMALPVGEFLMGSPKDEGGRASDEGPLHRVMIGRRCAIGRYPVTFDEYDHFCAATTRDKPADAGWGRSRRPVIDISWWGAVTYCKWLANETGQPYRLPSEAEWEYACRAGTTSRYAFGDAITPKDANYVESKLDRPPRWAPIRQTSGVSMTCTATSGSG
jgi:formylglycine-generating enzyme required for sulfatase activity